MHKYMGGGDWTDDRTLIDDQLYEHKNIRARGD